MRTPHRPFLPLDSWSFMQAPPLMTPARDVNKRIESRGGQLVRQVGLQRLYRVPTSGSSDPATMSQTIVTQHPDGIPPTILRMTQVDLTKTVATVQTTRSAPYSVKVTRADGYWIGSVCGLPGVHSFARAVAKLIPSIQDAIRVVVDAPRGLRIPVVQLFDIEDPTIQHALAVRAERLNGERPTPELVKLTREVAVSLYEEGLSVSDVGALLGISGARAAQITADVREPFVDCCEF